MDENRVGKLVKKAKGDDRSLREYARDSGVDAAIISKIINGTYVPKKTRVYRSLTSQEASPRGGVTYQQLIEAVDSSKQYQAGIMAGMGMVATEAALVAIGGLPIAALGMGSAGATALMASLASVKKKGDPDKADDTINEIQRFVATSNGIIFNDLGIKGISFQIEKKRYNELENRFDTYLKIDNQEVTEYIFRYAYLSKEHQKIKYLVENIPRKIIEELTFIEPSKKRKVSIVTNYEESYEYIFSHKGKLSYNGELSIILVDIKNVELLKEDYIAHYVGAGAPREMFIV